MISRRFAAALLSLLVAACNPFHKQPAVQIETGDVDLSQRWNATLATPSDLQGALQVHGSAWMAPTSDEKHTRVSVSVQNAAPGGVHPWHLHQGQCGNDLGVVGDESAYPLLHVNKDGKASASVTLDMAPPSGGDYFVSVHASRENLATVISCGNLAPPVH